MLKITPDPPRPADNKLFTASEYVSHEDALIYASDLLRCAMATAYELGDNLTDSKRDLAFSVLHLTEMAKAMVDRSLESSLPVA